MIRRFADAVEGAVLPILLLCVLWRAGKGLEATWLLAGLAVALTFVRWSRRSVGAHDVEALHATPLHVWVTLILFIVWTMMSYLTSSTQNYGLDEVLRDASLVLIALWVVSLPQREEFSQNLVQWISAATLIACLVGIAVYVLQPVNRFVGTFFDWRFHTDYWPNAWAEYLLLAWPIVALWTRRSPLLLRILIIGTVLGCLLLSYSRGAFLVVWGQLLLLAVFSLCSGIRSSSQWRTPFLVLCGSALTAVVLFFGINAIRAQFHPVESISRKATFTAEEGVSSISERQQFWWQSLALSWERPLLGWGPYSFRFVQPRLQTDVFSTSDHAHNVFLKLAMERGWPAVVFILTALLLILLPTGKRILSTGAGTMEAASLLSVSGVLTHNLIDYNLQFVGIALPLWLLLGMLVQPVPLRALNVSVVRTFELLLGIIIGCMSVLEGRYLVLSSLGRRAEARGEITRALAWYDRAQNEVFSRDLHLSRAVLSLRSGDLASAAAALDTYERANEEDPRLWILKGNTLRAEGLQEEALATFARAMEYGKYDYLEPLEGTLQILAEGNHPDVLSARETEFIGILKKFGEAMLRNAHFIALSQSVETFDRVSALLQDLYPVRRRELQEFTQKVLEHAEEERSKYSAKRPGLLW